MTKPCLGIDLSPAELQRVSDNDFVIEAVEVLRLAYAGDACAEALSRCLQSDLRGDGKTARLWAEVYVGLLREAGFHPDPVAS